MAELRDETAGDIEAIRWITKAAFAPMPYSSQTEAEIIDALRAADALTISLVADEDGEIVGHVAFSPVTIDGSGLGWYGLGPVSVRPDRQRSGVGSALIREGLDRLKTVDARGCVLLGDPGYYHRFGFANHAELRYPGAPPEYFMALSFDSQVPSGEVAYHEGFGAS